MARSRSATGVAQHAGPTVPGPAIWSCARSGSVYSAQAMGMTAAQDIPCFWRLFGGFAGYGPSMRSRAAELESVFPPAIFTGRIHGRGWRRDALASTCLATAANAGLFAGRCGSVGFALAGTTRDEGGPRNVVAHGATGFLLPVREFGSRVSQSVDFGVNASRFLPGHAAELREPSDQP